MSSIEIAEILLFCAFSTVIQMTANSQQPNIFPEEDWQETSPESQGINSVMLAEAMNYLGNELGGSGVSESLIIRNGYLIWKGSNIDAYHKIWSCTKCFTSTVLGLLIQDKKCTLDTFAVEYLPTLDDKYPEYAKITLRHLATMTSGYDAIGIGYDDNRWNIPTTPLAEPGAKYQYNDNAMNLFGYVLTLIAGEPICDLFKRRIADHIGLTQWYWGCWGIMDGLLINDASGYLAGIHITPRQFARFGYLFLNNGKWKDKQLIDKSWIDQATTNQVPLSIEYANYDGRGRYGFNWWTNGIMSNNKLNWNFAPSKTFCAMGGGTNYCFVIPEWDMVIVRMDKEAHLSLSRSNQIWDSFFYKLGKSLDPNH